jgi:hypothetical protein
MAYSELSLAWAAGIFEGEGTFNTYTNGKSETRYLRLVVSMVDEDIIKRFASVVGYGTVYFSYPPSRKNRGWQPMYTWQVNGKDAHKVLALIRPWFGERREKKTKEVLARVV